MTAKIKASSLGRAVLRLALFWAVGFVAMICYGGLLYYLPLPVPGTPLGTAIVVVGCFLISLAIGLWTKATPIIVRALTAVSCVGIPFIGVVLINLGGDL